MTNYERRKNMTIEEMAKDNVHPVDNIDDIQFYQTSDGIGFMDRKAAIAHELYWLKQEAEEE